MKNYKCEICKAEFTTEKEWMVKEDSHGNKVCNECYEKGTVCHFCDRILQGEEMESPREDNGGKICDECYSEHYQAGCPVCEDNFDMATEAEDYYFAITKTAIDDNGVRYDGKPMTPGVYKAAKSSICLARCLIYGFRSLNDGALQLIRKNDFPGEDFCDEICPDCVIRFARPIRHFAKMLRRKLYYEWWQLEIKIKENIMKFMKKIGAMQ